MAANDLSAETLVAANRGQGGAAGQAEPAEAVKNGDDPIVRVIEQLFFAYRDFISDPDEMLEALGYGRAHHRVLHFVNFRPGLRVADLLDILKITKQSLARVLKQLVDEGLIEQRAGEQDRRERLLFATERGAALFAQLIAPQIRRVGGALDGLDADGRCAVEQFLVGISKARRVRNEARLGARHEEVEGRDESDLRTG
ncbi:MAG: MarR family transcriptional regulator [Rhizobiales bacterium]|nr:MarR family transcriptional regulator [Hyphomicrobiales bacterium]